MLDKYDALFEANPYAQLNYRGLQHLAMTVNFGRHTVKKNKGKKQVSPILSDRYSMIALLLNKFPQKEQDTWEKRSTTKNKQRKQESGCGAENPRQNKLLDHNALLLYLLMVVMVRPDGRRSNPSMQRKLVDTICTLLQATTTFSASYLASIVGSAVETFLSNKMEWHFRGLSAVVAEDPNQFVLIWFRHWCSSYLHIILLPYLWHVTNRLRAKRASVLVVFPHLLQAVRVNSVPTWHNSNITSWFE